MFFFFNDTATTEIYTLSLHDALPICYAARGASGGGRRRGAGGEAGGALCYQGDWGQRRGAGTDRKSTRLNSSHQIISYAVFCLKKKTDKQVNATLTTSPTRCTMIWFT